MASLARRSPTTAGASWGRTAWLITRRTTLAATSATSGGSKPGSTEHTQVLRTSVAVQERLSASREQGQQSPSSLPPPFFKTDCSSGSSALASSVNVTARVETGLEPAVVGRQRVDDAGEEAFGLAQDQRLAQGVLGPELDVQSAGSPLPRGRRRPSVRRPSLPERSASSRAASSIASRRRWRASARMPSAVVTPHYPATADDDLHRKTSRVDSCQPGIVDGAGAP